MSREWYKLTAHALREAVRNGETTAVEATQSYLDRIKAVDGKVQALTNHNGGVTGGITNGMPFVVRVAIKPTPSIAREQQTVSLKEQADTTLAIVGRHDPCIVQRAVPVIEAVVAWTLWDLLLEAKKWEK